MKNKSTLRHLAIITLILFSLVTFIEFVRNSTATISDDECWPSNDDPCDWDSKTVHKYYFVVELICDEGHVHGDVIDVAHTSWEAWWCKFHTDLWSEPPTLLVSGIKGATSGSCPDRAGPDE